MKLGSISWSCLKPLYTFRKENKIKVHRVTDNLLGLQNVMVKDFPWNIIPCNALLFEKTLKQLSILDIENYGFILNTCHDTAKRAETRVGFPVIFSRLRWPIEPKFSQVCYFICIRCDPRSVGLGQYCLPKVSNGFKHKKYLSTTKLCAPNYGYQPKCQILYTICDCNLLNYAEQFLGGIGVISWTSNYMEFQKAVAEQTSLLSKQLVGHQLQQCKLHGILVGNTIITQDCSVLSTFLCIQALWN